MQKYLDSFLKLREEIFVMKEDVTPHFLYRRLFNWASQLEIAKNKVVQQMFKDYFLYFKKLDENNYSFEPLWYNMNELLEYNFFKLNVNELKYLVEAVRDVLWEIIVFKSMRNCKIFPNNQMRVFTNRTADQIIFCCDQCSYTEDFWGNKITVTEILLPASSAQIARYNILPGLS